MYFISTNFLFIVGLMLFYIRYSVHFHSNLVNSITFSAFIVPQTGLNPYFNIILRKMFSLFHVPYVILILYYRKPE